LQTVWMQSKYLDRNNHYDFLIFFKISQK